MARNINTTREIALNFKTNAKETADALNDVISKLDDTSQEYRDATIQLQKYEQSVEDLEAALNSTNTSQEQLLKLTEKANLEAKRSTTIVDNHTKSVTKQTGETKNLTKEVTSNGGAMAILDTITGGLASTTRDALEATTLFTTGTSASTIAQRALTAVVGTSTGALRVFRIALAATGIGVALVLIGSLVSAWLEFTSATDDATDAQRRFNLEISKSNFKELNDEIALRTALAKEHLRERGDDLVAYRRLEEQEYNERAKALVDYHYTVSKTDKEEADKALRELNLLHLQWGVTQARWRADDAESARNNAKSIANTRTKISKDNAAELIRIERELMSDLKTISEEHRKWAIQGGALDPSDDLIAANLKQIEKLEKGIDAIESKRGVRGYSNQYIDEQINSYTASIEMYEANIEALNKIRDEYTNLYSTNLESVMDSISDIADRAIVGGDLELVSVVIEQALMSYNNFIDSIKDNDLKTYYNALTKDLVDSLTDTKERLSDLDKSYNEFTEVNNNEFLESLRQRQNDLEQWSSTAYDIYAKAMDDIEDDFRMSQSRLESALEDQLISRALFDSKMDDLGAARRLREEEAQQDHIDRLNKIDESRKRSVQDNQEAQIAILSTSANAQAAHLDMVLSFMTEEEAERARSTDGYKTLAIATATMDTYTAAMSGYAGAMAMFSANPIVGNIVGIASIATAISTGIAQINAIRKVKVPGGGSGGGGSISASAGAAPNVQFVSSSENQIANSVTGAMNNQNQEPIKAYVVSSDVSSGQALERNKIESNSI